MQGFLAWESPSMELTIPSFQRLVGLAAWRRQRATLRMMLSLAIETEAFDAGTMDGTIMAGSDHQLSKQSVAHQASA
jgi:hypothetical protein